MQYDRAEPRLHDHIPVRASGVQSAFLIAPPRQFSCSGLLRAICEAENIWSTSAKAKNPPPGVPKHHESG